MRFIEGKQIEIGNELIAYSKTNFSKLLNLPITGTDDAVGSHSFLSQSRQGVS